MCPGESHNPYNSEWLADNAATLHVMANPNCGGIEAFGCEDHWHIGHHTATLGQQCKSDPEHVAIAERRHNGGRS